VEVAATFKLKTKVKRNSARDKKKQWQRRKERDSNLFSSSKNAKGVVNTVKRSGGIWI
jgi:hypothetical protein